MQLSTMDLPQGNLHQIELIAGEISEGVLILDNQQTIVWANAAALAMHGVENLAALGKTIDEYHANFQVRYRGVRKTVVPANSGGAAAGLRESLIEIISPQGDGTPALHRLRKRYVPEDSSGPRFTLLFVAPVAAGAEGHGKMVCSIKDAAGAMAVLRCRDGMVVDANDAFRRLLQAGKTEHAGNLLEDMIAHADSPARLRESFADAVSFAFTLISVPDQADGRKPALLAGQAAEYDGEACLILNLVEWEGLRPVVAAAVRQDPGTMQGFAAGLCAVTPGLAHVLDADMRVVAASNPWLDWIGLDRHTAMGRRITDFMTDEAAAHFAEKTWKVLTGGGMVRDQVCQFVNSAGSTIDAVISATATPGEDGGVLWAVLLTMDATDKRRADDRFTKLMALSPTPLAIRRMEDNRILEVNAAFMALTGYSADAVVFHGAEEFLHYVPKSYRQVMEQDLRAGKRVQKVDVKLKTNSGEMLDVVLSAEMMDVFGQNCALLAFQDVTDRRRSEAELFEAIETVMEDTTWFTRSVIERMADLRRPVRAGAPAPEIGDLTPREREVLGFISHGMTDADIAERLGLTRCTVRNHVAALYSKVGVHSRSSAIVWARERGMNLAAPLRGGTNFMRQAPPHRSMGIAVKGGARP